MHITKLDFGQINALSNRDIKYQQDPESFSSFINELPTIEGIGNAITKRLEFPVNRALLSSVLLESYHDCATSEQTTHINDLLSDHTFTIVTAHQPILLGGPAYYIYKIISILSLCNRLRKQYPHYKFVPVFISGAEDHDFDEVNKLNIFNQQLDWVTNQTGPVGRFTTQGLEEIIQRFNAALGVSPEAESLKTIFTDAHKNADSYNDFVFRWINDVFGKYGLLVLNMDNKALKSHFAPIIKKEIFETPSLEIVHNTQQRLEESFGFKPQAYVREINFFYMSPGRRDRIEFIDGNYHIKNTNLIFTRNELESEIDNHSERFSPNVIIRPLYQEYILPNIAYVGGGGEISYWLERQTQFAHFNIFFPVLIRRNSVMLLNSAIQKSLGKLSLSIEDIVTEETQIIKSFIQRHAGESLNLDEEYKMILSAYESLSKKAELIDPSLISFIGAESTKAKKAVEQIESKLLKAVKQRQDTQLQQISNLKSKLFPKGGLQERHDSFWTYFVNYKEDLIEKLLPILDPMDKAFLFIEL
jgi:bacillithiol biosynthesis cysteine-adding enzyme BshC